MTDQLKLRRLNPGEKRPPFECGDSDLNEFFHIDSIHNGNELMSVTYVAELMEGREALAFFCVSNDAIKKDDAPRSAWERMLKLLPRAKRYSSMPAVKIGRLAVSKKLQSNGVGTQLIDFMKMWFTNGNKTGCRFIVVDAYNNQRTIKFYQNNEFEFLTQDDEKGDTRLMYFDLMRFKLES